MSETIRYPRTRTSMYSVHRVAVSAVQCSGVGTRNMSLLCRALPWSVGDPAFFACLPRIMCAVLVVDYCPAVVTVT